jgi:periplasmic divalent cation tolerance protein
MDKSIWLVQTTLPGDMIEPIIGAWSTYFVDSGLTKCIQMSMINSIYEWESGIQNSKEWKIQMKVSNINKDYLIKLIKDKHPYDTPQIISWKVETTADYARWIEE